MSAWFLSLDFMYQLLFAFCAGMAFDLILICVILTKKNKEIILYKRKLEKEGISCTESEARVKVLESKIEVLEKALENALKNK